MENEMLDRVYENDIEWMVEAYAEYVYRLAYEFTCDPVDAENVTCATFLSAQALGEHVSECDCVASILYGITSSIAHDRLESNLSSDEPDEFQVPKPLSFYVMLPDSEWAATDAEAAGGYPVRGENQLDVSLGRFGPGLEAARAELGSVFGHGGYSI